MKNITVYKNKVKALNEKYKNMLKETNINSKFYFRKYLEDLNQLDNELIVNLRNEKKVYVYSNIF